MSVAKIISKFSKNSTTTVYVQTFESPVGKAIAAADDDFLYIVTFEDSRNYESHFEILTKQLSCKFVEYKNKLLQKFEEELSAYFEGKLKKFSIPIKTFGSEFQKVK